MNHATSQTAQSQKRQAKVALFGSLVALPSERTVVFFSIYCFRAWFQDLRGSEFLLIVLCFVCFKCLTITVAVTFTLTLPTNFVPAAWTINQRCT